MARFVFLLSIFLFSDICFSECQDVGTDNSFLCVKVVYVVDGDTFKVDINGVHPLIGKNMLIRILGVDAPEIHSRRSCESKAGNDSKEFLKNILMNAKRIDLQNVQKDKYFRFDARVVADGVDVGAALLSQKKAVSYNGGTKKKWACNKK